MTILINQNTRDECLPLHNFLHNTITFFSNIIKFLIIAIRLLTGSFFYPLFATPTLLATVATTTLLAAVATTTFLATIATTTLLVITVNPTSLGITAKITLLGTIAGSMSLGAQSHYYKVIVGTTVLRMGYNLFTSILHRRHQVLTICRT